MEQLYAFGDFKLVAINSSRIWRVDGHGWRVKYESCNKVATPLSHCTHAHTHTHTHTFLPPVLLPLHGHATPHRGGRAKLSFIYLVRSTTVDRQPSTTPKPSMECCALHCSTLFTHRLLSFWDALVTLLVTFPSEGSFAFITLYLVVRVFLGLVVISDT